MRRQYIPRSSILRSMMWKRSGEDKRRNTDEEFPASEKLLQDASADHYLMIEDVVTAGQIVMEKLVGIIEEIIY